MILQLYFSGTLSTLYVQRKSARCQNIRKIALDFSGAKFSLKLFVPHEFDMADGTSLTSGKAMLKDPLHTDVKR